MIAVNAWDEPKEVVAGFVAKSKLAQRILLMGGKVAEETFGVTTFPTTFLLDAGGTIIDREVGFTVQTLARKERKIRELIAAAKPR